MPIIIITTAVIKNKLFKNFTYSFILHTFIYICKYRTDLNSTINK